MAFTFLRRIRSSSEGIVAQENESILRRLQGNILQGHGRSNASHLFLTFTAAPAQVRSWVRGRAREGFWTNAWTQEQHREKRRQEKEFDGGLFATFSLSAKGYEYLDLPINRFERSFRAGMKAGENFIVESIESALNINNKDPKVETWEAPFQNEIHAMVMLADSSLDLLSAKMNETIASLQEIARVHIEMGSVLLDANEEGIEHFGYRDGISQPLFFRREIEEHNRLALPNTHDPSAPIELVVVDDPLVSDDFSCGSYLVFRKLRQDVAGFNQGVIDLAAELGISPELAGAQVVGRFKDGTPLTLHGSPQGNAGDINDFDYDGDNGSRCPLHAHTLKTNPRKDAVLNQERSRRIARRAIPYGRPDTKEEKGLLFQCYQSDISHQFEFMQRVWCDNPNFPIRLFQKTGDDPLIGQDHSRSAQQEWPLGYDSQNTKEVDFRAFVDLRGGEYFFTPSLPFLTTL
jgi:Dyp-type peroxidase family